ncbi:hypothetical protein AB3X52_00370 [Nocardioides sp. DS6]|uniref:Uncharacterized protein n=1 Tax=Nocardioides eburneus TaxID=3231482 RepID=A0ABV3SVJ9_9ACTN
MLVTEASSSAALLALGQQETAFLVGVGVNSEVQVQRPQVHGA